MIYNISYNNRFFSTQDPDAEYVKQARIVLSKLKLGDILQRVLESEEERQSLIRNDNREEIGECRTEMIERPGFVAAGSETEGRRREEVEAEGEEGNPLVDDFKATTDPVDGTSNSTEDSFPTEILRKSPSSLCESQNNTLHTLKGLVTHNEIFDTPMALDVNTPVIRDDSKSNRNKSVPNYTGTFTRLTNSSDELTIGFNQMENESTYTSCKEIPTGQANSESDSDSNQVILPSNLNHYPNIFASEEDLDETIEDAWPFSLNQEGPTQHLSKEKNCTLSVANKPISVTGKEFSFRSSKPSTIKDLSERKRELSPTTNENISISQKFKKFKFKKFSKDSKI